MSAEQNSSQPRHEKASDELIDAMHTLGSPVFTPYAALWPSSTRRSQSNTLDLGLGVPLESMSGERYATPDCFGAKSRIHSS